MTYNPLVHLGTVASSVAIVALGLIPARDRSRPAGPIDLGLVILCSTLAAPTVWTHHYGVTLPIFAVVLPATLALGGAARARGLALLVMAFVLISNNYRIANRLWDTPFNFLQSYVYFGGLMLLALVWILRGRDAASGPAPREPATPRRQPARDAAREPA
jgi:alpha-1,2-mannosyltransferase